MQNKTEKILAIDPGYDRCGVAVVETNERNPRLLFSTCIETNKKDPHEIRLATIFKALEAIVQEWNPQSLAAETLFFSLNKKTALKVAEARGVIILFAGLHQLPLIELAPQAVKQGITGAGNASKEQITKMVGLIVGENVSKMLDDEVDAIALGLAAGMQIKFSRQIGL